ncbi:MAG TPA: hypothetical protein VE130_09630 [Nitrososphaeraceae archaeon]|jgi:hypothetical protein|nr:hypothetical protein [Nitrososphaeraceae archaeon]
MQSQKLAIITAISALLLATSAVPTLTPQSASAYHKNQATSQTSACGNEFMPINVGCQNADSQIQGDENAAALTAQQTFPEVKKEPKPPKTATLQVCKHPDSSPGTYQVDVGGNNPSPDHFSLMPGDCQDVTIGPGDYSVAERETDPGFVATVTGDCTQEAISIAEADGNIQAGDTQSCTFDNTEL